MLVEGCVVKTLTAGLLALGIFASAVFAQSAGQVLKERHKVLAGWLGIVVAAEKKYQSAHGHYGDLTDLRKTHLLNGLVFESESFPRRHHQSEANFVPKSTLFQVTVSSDGKHFTVTISEDWDDGCVVSVGAGDRFGGYS